MFLESFAVLVLSLVGCFHMPLPHLLGSLPLLFPVSLQAGFVRGGWMWSPPMDGVPILLWLRDMDSLGRFP